MSTLVSAKYARRPSTGPIRPAQNGAKSIAKNWNEEEYEMARASVPGGACILSS